MEVPDYFVDIIDSPYPEINQMFKPLMDENWTKEDLRNIGMDFDTLTKCSTYLGVNDYIDVTIKSFRPFEKSLNILGIETSTKLVDSVTDKILPVIVPTISFMIKYCSDKELLKKHILNLFD